MRLPRRKPVAASTKNARTAPPASTPPRDFYLPQDQSVPLVGCPAACLPNPPDFRSLPAARNYLTSTWRRITVPGPLRFRRLAVPQTSWNHLHYAPGSRFSSIRFSCFHTLFLELFLFCFQRVTKVYCDSLVDKTRWKQPVLGSGLEPALCERKHVLRTPRLLIS
jgi:hypothetical protein